MARDFQLTPNSVAFFWKDKADSAGFIDYLLERESWTLDHDPRVEAELAIWASDLSKGNGHFLKSSEGMASFLTVLAFIGSDKAFFLLNKLSETFPTILNQLGSFASAHLEDDDLRRIAVIFLDRLRVANQHSAINSALGIDRLALVQYAIRQVIENHGKII